MGKKKLELVVRLSTSTYWRKGHSSICQERKLSLLKSKSTGSLHDIIDDLEYEWDKVIGLKDAKDGLYKLDVTNISQDCETGIIDDWDLKLTPMEKA